MRQRGWVVWSDSAPTSVFACLSFFWKCHSQEGLTAQPEERVDETQWNHGEGSPSV
jgi:hypothetical protein